MKKLRTLLFAALTVLMLAACGTTSKVPLTGRSHRIGVSDEQVLSLAKTEYTKYMQTAKLSTNTKATQMVKRVGTRLANAVENYLKNNGYADDIKNFSWEFNLVQDNNVNAFCMPGGKIVVYEGLLPYTQTDDELAIVLGHEIAHAVAKHSAEQLTKQQNEQLGTNIGANVIGMVTGSSDIANIAGTVASKYFSFMNLKYSRENESEADHMGLIFAAMAGYNPDVAVNFWKKMASGTTSQNEWLSDHPSDATRIKNIQGWLPEAEKYYKPQTVAKTTTTKKTTTKRSTTSRKRRK